MGVRNGTNAELVAVDERLVGHAPSAVSLTKAASMPLALITAWECLFEICRVPFNPNSVPNSAQGKRLLVLPGAGGTGSRLLFGYSRHSVAMERRVITADAQDAGVRRHHRKV